MGTTDLPLVAQLRQAIRDSGLSLNEIGRRAGVSEGQLSRFLRGDRTLTLPAAAKVCLYFGLELCAGGPSRHRDQQRQTASDLRTPARKSRRG